MRIPLYGSNMNLCVLIVCCLLYTSVDTFEEEEPIDIKAVMAEIKELEAKRAELDKEIEVYLKELSWQISPPKRRNTVCPAVPAPSGAGT